MSEKQAQLDAVEEKFVVGDIDKTLYQKFSTKYKEEFHVLEAELQKSDIDGSNLEKGVEKCLMIAQNLSGAWLSANCDTKQRLQILVFPEGILYNKKKEVVRTRRMNTLFAEIEPPEWVTDEIKKGNPIEDCFKNHSVAPTGIELLLPTVLVIERMNLRSTVGYASKNRSREFISCLVMVKKARRTNSGRCS